MDDSRRKLPSWMLGIKNNVNSDDGSKNNGAQKEEGKGKLVKACREAKRVVEKRRKRGGDEDEFERESSDGGERRLRKGNGEGNEESREGKERVGGSREDLEGGVFDDVVDDGIGYGKRKESVKVRKEKLGSDDYVDVGGDGGIMGERRKKGGRKRKGKGMIDVAESKRLELEEDEVEDDDGGGAQVVMRKCKGRRRGDRGKLVHSTDLVDVQGSDDEDLTVEDLVSIAEEYVNNDMEAAHHHSPPHGISSFDNLMSIAKEHTIEREEMGENHTSETSISDNTQSGGSLSSKLLNREEARPDSLLNENVTVMKPIMSGDPAQDMLDLFLGHLLKRPQEEEKKYDISSAVQRQEPVDPPVGGVPFTKKKSSLKDKVAMFFD